MKKNLAFKVFCTGAVAISACSVFFTPNTFAATSYIRLGSENIYSTSKKSNTAGTASYTSSIRTLTLNNYTGSDITTNVPNLKVVCNDTGTTVMTTDSTASTTPVTIAANICNSIPSDSKDETVENPDTLDPIFYYIALFVASSAILATGRYLVKRRII